MLSDVANAFSWNARNQVATLNSVSLQYDGFGRRTKNLQNTSFLFDGANAVQELSGSTPIANLISGGIDEILTRTDSGGAFTPLKDALGSTTALVDASGNLVTQYSYDPFGNTTVSGASNSNAFQYTGRENEGIGLYFYRARYYSPQLARFINEDPLGFAGSGPNFYAYVFDGPTNLNDPSGLAPGDWWDPRSYKTLPTELNPLNPSGTFYKEATSIWDSAAGTATGDWGRVAGAYDNSVYGQTEMYGRSCDKFNKYVGYYGTRGALKVAAIADLAALGLIALEPITDIGYADIGWTGGEITFTRPGASTPDWRINPWGDEDYGPHYHRRGPGGIGSHRPWDGHW
jgi:RHS repeat-associated protein